MKRSVFCQLAEWISKYHQARVMCWQYHSEETEGSTGEVKTPWCTASGRQSECRVKRLNLKCVLAGFAIFYGLLEWSGHSVP